MVAATRRLSNVPAEHLAPAPRAELHFTRGQRYYYDRLCQDADPRTREWAAAWATSLRKREKELKTMLKPEDDRIEAHVSRLDWRDPRWQTALGDLLVKWATGFGAGFIIGALVLKAVGG